MIRIDSTFFVEPSESESETKVIDYLLDQYFWKETVVEENEEENEEEKLEDGGQGSGSIPLRKKLQNMFTKNKSKKRW